MYAFSESNNPAPMQISTRLANAVHISNVVGVLRRIEHLCERSGHSDAPAEPNFRTLDLAQRMSRDCRLGYVSRLIHVCRCEI